MSGARTTLETPGAIKPCMVRQVDENTTSGNRQFQGQQKTLDAQSVQPGKSVCFKMAGGGADTVVSPPGSIMKVDRQGFKSGGVDVEEGSVFTKPAFGPVKMSTE